MEPAHRPKVFDLAHAIPQSEDTGLKQIADGGPSKRKHKKAKNHHQNYVQSNNNANETADGEAGTEEDE